MCAPSAIFARWLRQTAPGLLAVLAMTGVSHAQQREATQIETKALEIVDERWWLKEKADDLSMEERDAVIALLRKAVRSESKYNQDSSVDGFHVYLDGARKALFRLGDEDFIRESVLRFRKAGGKIWSAELRTNHHPAAIQYLAEGLYDSEDFRDQPVDDLVYSAVPVDCARAMAACLQLNAFPLAVREQARTLAPNAFTPLARDQAEARPPYSYSGSNAQLVRLMRKWWEINALALKERRYQDVLPPQ